jgi:hypothetical protein
LVKQIVVVSDSIDGAERRDRMVDFLLSMTGSDSSVARVDAA